MASREKYTQAIASLLKFSKEKLQKRGYTVSLKEQPDGFHPCITVTSPGVTIHVLLSFDFSTFILEHYLGLEREDSESFIFAVKENAILDEAALNMVYVNKSLLVRMIPDELGSYRNRDNVKELTKAIRYQCKRMSRMEALHKDDAPVTRSRSEMARRSRMESDKPTRASTKTFAIGGITTGLTSDFGYDEKIRGMRSRLDLAKTTGPIRSSATYTGISDGKSSYESKHHPSSRGRQPLRASTDGYETKYSRYLDKTKKGGHFKPTWKS
mmetsp:Transcript_46624/g.53766  ORF Transcript_46624/g.53766 Transcript_46624/m.53766 type:complete len:269 (+) Transcript_46624:39-845(+)